MTNYEKIADWIVSQNIDKSVNSTDIKEIADYIFNIRLNSTGVLKVKEYLKEKGIAVRDSNCVIKRGDKVKIPNKDVYGTVLKVDGDVATVEYETKGDITRKDYYYLNELCNKDFKDAKIKDEKYIVYLNGEPYYTAKSYDEAMRVESQLYSASDSEEDFQAYYGSYPDVEIRKIRDREFKDREEIPWYDKIKKGQPMNIILTGKQVTLKKLQDAPYSNYWIEPRAMLELGNLYRFYKINRDYWEETTERPRKFNDKEMFELVKTYFKKYPDKVDRDVVLYFPNIKAIKDAKFKDSKKLYWDLEYDRAVDENYIEKLYNKMVNLKYIDPNKESYEEFKESAFDEITEDKKAHYGIEDSKLPRNQKLWYGEELEKVVDPKFLRRNYQNKRLKTRKLRRRRKK